LKPERPWRSGYLYCAFLLPFAWWITFISPYRTPPLVNFPSNTLSYPTSRPILIQEEIEAALRGDEAMIVHLLRQWNQHPTALITSVDELKIFPQTFSAASQLLSLVSPNCVTALPNGFRNFLTLYSPQILQQIPYDIDRYNSERLLVHRPDLALIAPYSHPQMVALLQAYEIPFTCLASPQTISEISAQLEQLPSQRSLLLAQFVRALFQELWQRAELARSEAKNPPHILLLQYTGHLEPFAGKVLWEPFLQALAIDCPSVIPSQTEMWAKEPPEMIILAASKQTLQTAFHQYPFLRKCPKIFLINQRMANFSTHLNALAWFEFVQAYTQVNTKNR
jgi:hypothetical protein